MESFKWFFSFQKEEEAPLECWKVLEHEKKEEFVHPPCMAL